jgi:hypothetical protein
MIAVLCRCRIKRVEVGLRQDYCWYTSPFEGMSSSKENELII